MLVVFIFITIGQKRERLHSEFVPANFAPCEIAGAPIDLKARLSFSQQHFRIVGEFLVFLNTKPCFSLSDYCGVVIVIE